MPDEIITPNTAEATPAPVEPKPEPVETPPPTEIKPKFTLERIDADNVKKIDSRPDVTVINIPALQKEKEDMEATMAKFKTQLDQINEVLDEYKNLPEKP